MNPILNTPPEKLTSLQLAILLKNELLLKSYNNRYGTAFK